VTDNNSAENCTWETFNSLSATFSCSYFNLEAFYDATKKQGQLQQVCATDSLALQELVAVIPSQQNLKGICISVVVIKVIRTIMIMCNYFSINFNKKGTLTMLMMMA